MALRSANVIGSGPNGLAAAITLAQQGVDVTVYERNATAGGACATAEVTLPGFRHDLGSSAYPLGIASPFFRSLPLAAHGLRWIEPDAAVAHPLDDATAVVLEHSLDETSRNIGPEFMSHDAVAWRRLLGPSVRDWNELVGDFTQPLLRWPSHPVAMGFFGVPALLPARSLARLAFTGERARAVLAGCAAHSVVPLTQAASAATGLVLATAAHTTGWPIVAGGAQSLTDALLAHLRSLGGKLVLDADVADLRALPAAEATFFDTSIATLQRLAADALAPAFVRRLQSFQPGPGIFKLDYALSEPIPWRARDCLRAATVHVGGSLNEIARSERDACRLDGRARHSEKPFVLVVQPSLFDPSRAPEGKHTAWAYCHVPYGSTADRTEAIEDQLERFAPGFRDCVLARRASNSATLAAWNPNLAGGDVSGGAMTLQQLVLRPTAKLYRTGNRAVYLCSSSTPPGGGVHGMCGHLAARAALDDWR